jgi:hypothetical protein
MVLLVGNKVRFLDRYKPPHGEPLALSSTWRSGLRNSGTDCWVRARFGDFITPWIEALQFERLS